MNAIRERGTLRPAPGRARALWPVLIFGLLHEPATLAAPEVAFNRIIHGWTNYSTAFAATHGTEVNGEYATLATFYTPEGEVTPTEYAAIVIWGQLGPPNFAAFQFRVGVWSSLDAFTREPRQGDLATWNLTAPTGGSTSVPDTTTRGGRPAYELRFRLDASPVVLSNEHSYLIGFAALADTQSQGELFVPTSSHPGPSDVQAGDLIIGGWRYLDSAGGNTVYSGQLAVELLVTPGTDPPPLAIQRLGGFMQLSWPATAQDFVLEFAFELSPNADWLPVDAEPFEEERQHRVVLPASFGRQWFRLRRQ